MRTIKQTGLTQDTNITKFPDGQIQNKTDSLPGTPVVREIYGDILTNIYAILRDAGIDPNGIEDSSTASYQLLDALKVFANDLNDINKIITVSSSSISVNLNIDNLPSGYVFFGKITDALNSGVVYDFTGTGVNTLPVQSTSSISASSYVIAIIEDSGLKIIDISSSVYSDIHVPFGAPLSFNDTNTPIYLINGRIITNDFNNYNTQSIIRTSESNVNINIIDAVAIKGCLICLGFDTVLESYNCYLFELSDLNSYIGSVSISSAAGMDKRPYMFTDGTNIYFTNSSGSNVGNSDNNYDLSKWLFNEVSETLSLVSTSSIDVNFQKTTNAFILNDNLYTFVSGNLYAYPLSGGTRQFIDYLNIINGIVFRLNGNTYYSNGEFGMKWQSLT